MKPIRHHLDKRATALADKLAEGDPDDRFTTAGVAVALGLSPTWVNLGRVHGYGPRHTRCPPRGVAYTRRNIIAWLRERAAAWGETG